MLGNNLTGPNVNEGHLNYASYRNVLERKLRLLTECASCNTRTNVATKRRRTSTFPRTREGILERKIKRQMDRVK